MQEAAALVHRVVAPTPQYCWPLLSRRVGAELWVKHENHTPIGAFKIRGGLVYLDAVRRSQPDIRGVVTATTGNHGQSIALAAARLGIDATIVVPYGNSIEKNRAMEGLVRGWSRPGTTSRPRSSTRPNWPTRETAFCPLLRSATGARVASYALELFARSPT